VKRAVLTAKAWRVAKGAVEALGAETSAVVVVVEAAPGVVTRDVGIQHGDRVSASVERQAELIRRALVKLGEELAAEDGGEA